jgi:hypothetical protein
VESCLVVRVEVQLPAKLAKRPRKSVRRKAGSYSKVILSRPTTQSRSIPLDSNAYIFIIYYKINVI